MIRDLTEGRPFRVLLLLSAAVMAAGLFACGPLLDLLQIPSDLREMCEVYLRIYLFGLPFLFLYNMAGSLFQALGDSRTPWRFLAAASVLNVLLDLLFAAVLNMGIPGTAWGTFLAQGFSAVGSCAALLRPFRRRILREAGPLEICGHNPEAWNSQCASAGIYFPWAAVSAECDQPVRERGGCGPA